MRPPSLHPPCSLFILAQDKFTRGPGRGHLGITQDRLGGEKTWAQKGPRQEVPVLARTQLQLWP